MTRKKKKAKKQPKSEKKKIIIVLLVIFVIWIGLVKLVPQDSASRRECPYEVSGNTEAAFTLKYVDSPGCVWCWFTEPKLKNLVEKYGDHFSVEKYDIRYCTELVKKHKLFGTPSFVFSLETEDGLEEYAHTGYIEGFNLEDVICEITGACI